MYHTDAPFDNPPPQDAPGAAPGEPSAPNRLPSADAPRRDATLKEKVKLAAAWAGLFRLEGQVTELRALEARDEGRNWIHTKGGYYDSDHLEEMAGTALAVTPRASGVYFLLNPLFPEVLARRVNRFDAYKKGEGASDSDILRRMWLLTDFDPVRLRGISATDAEKALAREVALAAREYVRGLGWPDPIFADSGNGYHQNYRIDLEVDDGRLCERVLKALAARFDTEHVKIDPVNHNPSRICKFYGTKARKGDSVPERPHRPALILEVPGVKDVYDIRDLRNASVGVVTREMLEAVAGAAPAPPAAKVFLPPRPTRAMPYAGDRGHLHRGRLDVARWLTDRSVAFSVKDRPDSKGRTVYVLSRCPFKESHGDRACITQEANGKPGAMCQKASCDENHWQEFKLAIGAPDPWHYIREGGERTMPSAPPTAPAATEGPGPSAPPTASAATEGEAGRLPVIQENRRQLRDVTADAVVAVIAANDPPEVFQRGVLTRVRVDKRTGKPALEPLELDALRGVVARVANWVRLKDTKHGPVEEPVAPPMDVVRDLASLPGWDLPVVEAIIECPAYDRRGVLVDRPGYDAGSGLWLHLHPSLAVPPVPESPTPDDLARTRHLLEVELLGDFPFAEAASRANALAALVTPLVRHMIDGPTPLCLVSAPTEGTGKDLLVNCLCLPATGRTPEVTPEFRDEAEAQKKITALLLQAPTFVLLGNLSRALDSATLAAALTSETWTDRVLGGSKMANLPVTCCWLANGNNPKLSKELVRRTYLVRIDAATEHPSLRTGFRHPNLLRWAKANRGELVWAALTMVRAWVVAGRPKGTQTMGSFDAWVETLGGILDVAGVPDFLGNAHELRRTTTDRQSEWKFFVLTWSSEYGRLGVGVDKLYELATRNNLLDRVLGDKGERSQRTKLGKALGQLRDKVVEGFRVREDDKDHSGRLRYMLEPVAGGAALPAATATALGDCEDGEGSDNPFSVFVGEKEWAA